MKRTSFLRVAVCATSGLLGLSIAAGATQFTYNTLGASDTFSTWFQFRFTDSGGIDPADGITFVLAASPTGLGGVGGAIGYQGVANSMA
ncbi:MAG: lectin-like domain-containing protein, partial [Bryobacteraceae bacterium]